MISVYQGRKVASAYGRSGLRHSNTDPAILPTIHTLGGAIMMMSLILFENEFLNIVAISFTALVLNELIMVALEISTW